MINWPKGQPPLLVVVVDAEADFDWAASPQRRARILTSIKSLPQTQHIFERYKVRPTFVVDYRFSNTPEGYKPIRHLYRLGACEIGAHLQPWDNPPIAKLATQQNSYPGNLPRELEREKLIRLTNCINENLGVRPRIYKAGRFGVGCATAEILADLGYEVDLSVVPGTDLSPHFGPNFLHCGARPYWFGENPRLLEIPLSVDHIGLLASPKIKRYGLTMDERLKALHMPAILARLGLLERVALTPEGTSFDKLCRLARSLLYRGHRVFNFTYHSTSLAPGNTPYVRNVKDLQAFLRRIDQFLDFFMTELGGRAVTPFEIKTLAEQCNSPQCNGRSVSRPHCQPRGE